MSKNINDGYRLAHTMIRVKDLETSFNFYCKTLGMKVLRKTDYPDGTREAVLAFHQIQDGKVIRMETGATLLP